MPPTSDLAKGTESSETNKDLPPPLPAGAGEGWVSPEIHSSVKWVNKSGFRYKGGRGLWLLGGGRQCGLRGSIIRVCYSLILEGESGQWLTGYTVSNWQTHC